MVLVGRLRGRQHRDHAVHRDVARHAETSGRHDLRRDASPDGHRSDQERRRRITAFIGFVLGHHHTNHGREVTMRVAPARKGFTLLEVILAVMIALMLQGGLYVAMDAQLRQMEEGREVVENSSTGRQLLVRMTQDLSPSVGALQPVSTSNSSSSAATGASATTPTSSATTTPITFQLGVRGEADRVAIFRTRLTRATINPQPDVNGNVPPPVGDVS